MRRSIWNYCTSFFTPGQILPWWMLLIRWVLYPLDSFYWRMANTRGYQPYSDTWNIHGVHYTDQALRTFAAANGEIYKIKRNGDAVWLTQMPRDIEQHAAAYRWLVDTGSIYPEAVAIAMAKDTSKPTSSPHI